jgi:hypothetical protein
MANEKRASFELVIQPSAGHALQLRGQFVGDLTGRAHSSRQQVATGSWQALSVVSLSSIERAAFYNEDETNYVELAWDSGGTNKFAKLEAQDGTYVPCPAGTTTIYLRANGSACWVSFIVTEP